MSVVSIIDYGIGNILSVRRAFEHQGAEVIHISTPEEIKKAERLVLPGVGAFKDGMEELRRRELVLAIRQYCGENRPFLGICLGMQMMLEESEEFGNSEGLGIIPGKVVRIANIDIEGHFQKIPHVGWSGLRYQRSVKGTILDGIPEGERMYFVHSYTVLPAEDRFRLADTFYGGRRLSAVIQKGNCYGTQFHPEKSGEAGLDIVCRFLDL